MVVPGMAWNWLLGFRLQTPPCASQAPCCMRASLPVPSLRLTVLTAPSGRDRFGERDLPPLPARLPAAGSQKSPRSHNGSVNQPWGPRRLTCPRPPPSPQQPPQELRVPNAGAAGGGVGRWQGCLPGDGSVSPPMAASLNRQPEQTQPWQH